MIKPTKVDLILHPIRMRIIRALVGNRHLTAQQLQGSLPDVPQATLYRHLNALVEGKVLAIVEENQVRGTVERVYGLLEQAGNIGPEELNNATPDEHMQYFMAFVTSIIQDFQRYLDKADIDLVRDGVGYRQIPLYLSPEEMQQMGAELNGVLAKYFGKPESGRTRRMLTTIIIPEWED